MAKLVEISLDVDINISLPIQLVMRRTLSDGTELPCVLSAKVAIRVLLDKNIGENGLGVDFGATT